MAGAKPEESVRESEQLGRVLLKSIPDIAHLIGEDGTILDLNDAMAASLGGTRKELIGSYIFDKFTRKWPITR